MNKLHTIDKFGRVHGFLPSYRQEENLKKLDFIDRKANHLDTKIRNLKKDFESHLTSKDIEKEKIIIELKEKILNEYKSELKDFAKAIRYWVNNATTPGLKKTAEQENLIVSGLSDKNATWLTAFPEYKAFVTGTEVVVSAKPSV